jgi:RNA polymerase sigma factor (sigma-70 family)
MRGLKSETPDKPGDIQAGGFANRANLGTAVTITRKRWSEWMRELFPETSWTLLAKARGRSEEGALAREEFARRYYGPVWEFLRVLVRDQEKARDLSQEFFTRLSESRGLLERADAEKGPFRNYLQKALRNLVIDYHRRNRKEALDRHSDQAAAEGREVPELAEFAAADAAFHHAWVKVTLAEALTRVRALCLERKQDVHLALFEARYLCRADRAPSWEELGAHYGMDQKTARDRAETVVRHFRIVLRRMLRNEITVHPGARVTEAAIDEEIKALLSPLRD